MGRFALGSDWRRSVLLRVAMSGLVNVWLRRWLLRRWGALLADNAHVMDGSFFYSPNFNIGAGSFLNRECYIDTYAQVTIGSISWVGPRVTILTATHEIGYASQRAGPPTGKPVTIGDGCWVGGCATILPGVTVGEGCVIAAGSVVTEDCRPNSVYRGIPAARIRNLGLGLEPSPGPG